MKKFIVALSILTVIAGIVGYIIFQRQYIVLDEKYKKDTNELFINDVTDEYIEKMYDFDNLTFLAVMHSEITSTGINKILQLPNLNQLLFLYSSVDFSGAEFDSPERIDLALSNVKNLKELANCSSLTVLNISGVVIDDKLVMTDNTAFHEKYSLKDSSDFAFLDNLETLEIYNTEIEDISGFMEMDSLQTFTVTKDYISEEYIKALEENGITVIEEDEAE